MLLQDKVAIVNGVGPGLGRALCVEMAKQGADVVLAARTESRLEEVAAEVRGAGRRALVVPTDATDDAQAKRLAEAAAAEFGRIDVLVNNAAKNEPFTTVVDSSVDEWRACLDDNVMAHMQACKYAAPYMIEQRSGSIINVSSVSMRKGVQTRSAYSAAKAAIAVMTQSLADELGPHQVRVNCVVPGHIWGELLESYYHRRAGELGVTYDEVYQSFADQMALRRIALDTEVAAAIIFLASDMASAITGQSLDVNAGLTYH